MFFTALGLTLYPVISNYVNKKVLDELGITLPDSIKNDKAYVEM